VNRDRGVEGGDEGVEEDEEVEEDDVDEGDEVGRRDLRRRIGDQ
jgi:hypothetical protein